MQKHLTSIQNPLVKQVVQLSEKSKERKKQGLFVVEGLREIVLALKGTYILKTLFYCDEIISVEALKVFQGNSDHPYELISVSKEVYEKMAYRASTEGVIGLFQTKSHLLSDLHFTTKNPLILVAEAPEKPGNIGALLRTADAAKLDAVIIANPKTDLYNPNSIRSSVGCVFTNQVATGSTKEILHYLKQHHIAIFSAALQASIPYVDCDFKNATAIVVGTEAEGLSDVWLTESDQNIMIPMQGHIDSMNVSVAAGILIFEAKRQRGFSLPD
ncbi:MAG TPA: RNA methyltransferase [Flavobacteriaceae bacterium]|nr:RNA methyltransferase [Flavobacteriaceae bacterium]MCB9212420.1 RNA methyltransferase [Alteromonas sp.]HPF11696.1 RNA methyltransferase [Flavobacteriaceae bacterium]HQU20171.1 RNA methyltransferase [Flavobacteriaceae bacterium]HQU64740.1 RNA methyltransferase [Flavobacteriaceae bacterium]